MYISKLITSCLVKQDKKVKLVKFVVYSHLLFKISTSSAQRSRGSYVATYRLSANNENKCLSAAKFTKKFLLIVTSYLLSIIYVI
jgi:hypothetical protein